MKGEEMLELEAEFPIQRELSYAIGIQTLSSVTKDRIRIIENEVVFLVIYRHCLSNLDDPSLGKKKFDEILGRCDATLKKQRIFDEAVQGVKSWETVCSELVQEIQSYKKIIWEDFLVFVDCSYYCSFTVLELLKLIRYLSVLELMNDELQLQSLQKKLQLFGRILVLYSEHWISCELEIKNIGGALGEWVWIAASLYLLNWALDEKDPKTASKIDEYLSMSNRKFNKILLDVTKICLSLLKDTTIPSSSSSSSSDQNLKVDQLVSRFNGLQLENLREHMAMDDIQLLSDGVILLITFLMDPQPPEANAYAALDRLLTLVVSLDAAEMNDEPSNQFLLHDFLEMVNTIKPQGKVNNMESDFKSQNAPTLSISPLGSCEKKPKATDFQPYDDGCLKEVTNTTKTKVRYPSGANNSNVQTMMDEVVVGLESKIRDMRDLLMGGSRDLQIISIVGIGGLGKTTLAKKVYNDPSIKCRFSKSAWCTVSQSYDTKELLLGILNDLIEVSEKFSRMEVDDLTIELYKSLKGRRYLIVMDDIWDDKAWNELKIAFPDDQNMSRILFTSRNQHVVSRVQSDGIRYPLSPLSNEECWHLLEWRLFHGEEKCPTNFTEVGKGIAKQCEGLPSAVVLAAALVMENVQSLSWWEQIRGSLSRRVAEKDGFGHIMNLSYEHLTEPLKDCFLYLGLYQDDKVIGVKKLTKLLISEGLIQQKEVEEKDLEMLAQEYLRDLVYRSLLIISGKSSNGGIKSCRLHDFWREFCLRKSEEKYFFKLVHEHQSDHHDEDSKNYGVLLKNAQKLSSFLASRNIFSSSSPLDTLLAFAKTFEPFGKEEKICDFFCNLRHLRVLDLETVYLFREFPETVTVLTQLRYLAIWCTNNYLPEKIEELRNLQTLVIRTQDNDCTSIFPSKLLLMENLRHLDIGRTLHQIRFRNSKQPQMKNIRSFSNPRFDSGKEAKNFLRMIPGIHKLRCQFSSSSYSWNNDSRRVEIDFLSNLESLNMTYVGKDVSRYEFFLPSSLKKLTLSNFKLQWSEVSRFSGMLPNLEVLKLLGDSVIGEEWCMNEDEQFLRLKFLKLRGLKIVRWDASDYNFPVLEQIIVEQCHKLEEIPNSFCDSCTLNTIQVRRCKRSVLNSAEEIQREQIEWANQNFQLLSKQILERKFFG